MAGSTTAWMVGAMIASAAVSHNQAQKQAQAQAQAQKKALEAQTRSQKEAQEMAQALDRQKSIDAKTGEVAQTEYGIDRKVKAMTSQDLIVPSSFDTSIGTTTKKTGLGF